MIKNINHIGIAVHSLEDSLPFYTETLNLPLLKIEDVPNEEIKVAFLQVGEVNLELLEPTTKTSTVKKFLERRGEGIHHIAFNVSSIEERIEYLKESGLKMINDKPKQGANNCKIAFIHPKSTNGVLYELCEAENRVTSDD